MDHHLKEIEEGVPYNSFGKVLLVNGIRYPDALGGNCVLQCRLLANRLIRDGYGIRFLNAQERPHYVVIAEGDRKQKYYLDPFLLHKNAIPITDFLRGKKGAAEFDAYPIVKGHPKKLEFVRTGQDTFTVQAYWYDQTLRRYVTSDLARYSYDMRTLQDHLPRDSDQIIASVRQNFLQLQILEPNHSVSKVYFDPYSGNMNYLRMGEKKIRDQVKPAEFMKEMERLCSLVRVDFNDLVQYFAQAALFYQRIRASDGTRGSASHPRS